MSQQVSAFNSQPLTGVGAVNNLSGASGWGRVSLQIWATCSRLGVTGTGCLGLPEPSPSICCFAFLAEPLTKHVLLFLFHLAPSVLAGPFIKLRYGHRGGILFITSPSC